MLRTLKQHQIQIGPADHGRRMSLDEFDHAIALEEQVYELNKGVIEVSEVPPPFMQSKCRQSEINLRSIRNRIQAQLICCWVQ